MAVIRKVFVLFGVAGVFLFLAGTGPTEIAAACPGCTCAGPDLKVSRITCEEITPGVYRVVAEVKNCGSVNVTTPTRVEFSVFEDPPFDGLIKGKNIPPVSAGATITLTSGAMATGSFSFCTAEVDVNQQVSECAEGLANQTFPGCSLLSPASCCYCFSPSFPFALVPYDCAGSPPAGCTPCC